MMAWTVFTRRRVLRASLSLALAAVLLLTNIAVFGMAVSADSIVWRGEYYNNTDISGTPAMVRDDAGIDFNWGSGSPGGGVNADYFSVRWTTFANFGAGTYTFFATVDDGVRLWVDDQLIIDQWRDQATTTFSTSKSLTSGYHSLRVEYYDRSGDARITVGWYTGSGDTISDWRGEYYNNTSLTGTPALVRNDLAVNFNWGAGSPGSGVVADYFSARWTRNVSFATSSNYVFSVTTDDGARVWVDGSLIIDKWYAQSPTTHTQTVYLAAGAHSVRVEYFEATGTAQVALSWWATSGGPVSPGGQEVIVDNSDPGFVWGGTPGAMYSRAYGYRSSLYWTWNSNAVQYNWGKWFPNLPAAGNWEVYVYIPSRYFGTKHAVYSIYHSGARNDVVVNQNNYYNQWVSLGTYSFSGGGGEYVLLTDVTGEAYATRYVGFDAVKFVLRDGSTPPSPPPSGCTITPVLGFGRIWSTYSSVRSKLGCASDLEKSVWMGEQALQGGVMFWRQDTDQIYVLFNTGTWQAFTDTWNEGDPEIDPSIVAPPGYYQPKRGFGKVWRDNPAVRAGVGWGTADELGFQGSIQAFNGGQMLWSPTRGIFVLYSDGHWERYN